MPEASGCSHVAEDGPGTSLALASYRLSTSRFKRPLANYESRYSAEFCMRAPVSYKEESFVSCNCDGYLGACESIVHYATDFDEH